MGQIVDLSISIGNDVVQNKKVCRPMTQRGMLKFHYIISNTSWDFIGSDEFNVECKFVKFMDVLEQSYKSLFPKKKYIVRSDQSNQVSWFNEEIRGMREHLKLLDEISRQYNNCYFRHEYVQYKTQYRRAIKKAKIARNDNLMRSSNNPGRCMWQIIKNNQGNYFKLSETCKLTSNDFNNYFSNIAHNLVKKIPQSNRNPLSYLKNITKNNNTFSFTEVTFNKIRDLITDLKNKNSKDIFGLNVKLIKCVKNEIVIPLTKLINLCLREGICPSVLKRALVVPIFKKGDSNAAENYRPISLLPIISKILEKCMAEQIVNFFESNGLFSECQFGFRRDKNTVLGVLDLISDILRAFQEMQYDTVLFCDLSKAFDCVDHGILLQKLKAYNFSSKSLQLLNSYLEGRSQSVQFSGVTSARCDINIGVPQGSVLGRILFLIYINDLPLIDSSPKYTLFADDTTVSFRAETLEDSIGGSREAQERAEEWFRSNKLVLNADKTNRVVFSMRGGVNLQVEETKFLGVYLDQRLQWGPHINQVASKLTRGLYLLRNLANNVSVSVLRTAYFGVFHAHLTYAVLAWGHAADVGRLFRLQRKAIRILAGLKFRDDCRDAFRGLGILTLTSVYILQNLLYIRKNLTLYDTHEDVHKYCTRNRTDIVPLHCRLRRCQDGPGYWGIKFFNVLPAEVRILPFNSFKLKIRNILTLNSFYSIDEFLTFSNV